MMTRWIAAFLCVLSLAIAAPLGNEAEADGVARKASYKHLRCTAPAMLWRASTSWVCNTGQKCCYDRVLRKGTCIEASARCF